MESQPLLERPILSSALVLFIAGVLSFGASYASLWLPGANGRFDEELVPSQQTQANLPRRPRRYFLPALVAAIVLRMELIYPVNQDLQCAVPGVECFLPVLLLLYELLPGRKPRAKAGEKTDTDTFAQNAFEDLDDWMQLSKPMALLSGLLLSCGLYLATVWGPKSTYFCAASDRRLLVLWSQAAGLVLDAVIVVLAWRVLSWAKTTKSRLRTLSGILLGSSAALGVLLTSWRMSVGHPQTPRYNYRGVGSLFVFDILADGFAFSVFCVSAVLVVCESTPSALANTIALFSGLISATTQTRSIGTWENVRRFRGFGAFSLLISGFVSFAYSNGVRSVLFVRRVFLIALLAIFFIVITVYTLGKGATLGQHSVGSLLQGYRIEADRFMIHASVSKTLKVAVQEYKERNHGREPPPNFDIWYEYATTRNSPIIDHFDQIGRDILPFWGLPRDKLRQGLEFAAKQPDIAVVKIQDGTPSHGVWIDNPCREVMDDLISLIKPFSQHLPNMEFAVNCNDRPRVLAPWDDVQRLAQAGLGQGLRKRKLLSTKQPSEFTPSDYPSVQIIDKGYAARADTPKEEDVTSPHAYSQMTALSCSPGTKGRSGVYWNTRDFCSTCAAPQSLGPFVRRWDIALDICHQPDLARLHGFHITPPKLRPFQNVLPIFSRSKTGSYADIILPLRPRLDGPEDEPDTTFEMKNDALFWRGHIIAPNLNHDLLHGGHQTRLVHMINSASSTDKGTMLLPHPYDKSKYRYESVPATELKHALPIDARISKYEGCTSHSSICEAAIAEFGHDADPPPALKNRYVLLTDSDDGPPISLLPAVRSTSLPFLSSIFREWYTERLHPWIHFVPIDVRYQGLWSTLSYFTGLTGRGDLNGRDPGMEAKLDDATWIAEEGRKWAAKALRREDQEIYLFRLLLEWARVIDEKREDIGFVLKE